MNRKELARCSAGTVECVWKQGTPSARTLKVRDDKAPYAARLKSLSPTTIAARLAGRVEKSATIDEVLAWESSGNAGGVDCNAVSARYGALNAAGWAKPPCGSS